MTLVLTGVSALWMPARIYSAFTQPHDGGSRPLVLVRHLFSIIGFAMLICATVRMAFKMGDSRKLLAGFHSGSIIRRNQGFLGVAA